MHFPFMDLRRGSKIEVDTNLPWPKSFYINREQRFCIESILGRIYFRLHSGRSYYIDLLLIKMAVLAMFQENWSQFKIPSTN